MLTPVTTRFYLCAVVAARSTHKLYFLSADQTQIPYGPNQLESAEFWFQNLDGIFSSSVDFSFALCGLVDAGVLNLSNKLDTLFISFVYLFIVVAYALCMCWPPIISPATIYQNLYLVRSPHALCS